MGDEVKTWRIIKNILDVILNSVTFLESSEENVGGRDEDEFQEGGGLGLSCHY
jgi:hypothetical protein